MLYIEKSNILEKRFLNLLDNTKVGLLEEVRENKIKPEKVSGLSFEKMVYEHMIFAAKKTEFEQTIRQSGPHGFPDIVAKGYFGAEIKMTSGNKWVSTGNSILESTRRDGVEKIYIFFGKFGGEIDFKYRQYQDCLYDIGVTHSPRYKINMDLPDGETIFNKMAVDYDVLRKDENPIKLIKKYYKSTLKDGEELWWIDQNSEEESVSPIIRSFRKLEPNERQRFLVESMILFPEIFGKSSIKFERLGAYLVTNYNSVSSNLRDIFTAGGQVDIMLDSKKMKIPQLVFKMYQQADLILHLIKEIPQDVLFYYWKGAYENEDRLAQWLNEIDRQSSGSFTYKLSDIFFAGVKAIMKH